MATQCTSTSINGSNNCEKFLGATKALIVSDPNLSFATENSALNVDTWRTYLQEKPSGYPDIPMYITRPIKEYEPTGAEPVVVTDGFGADDVERHNPPKMVVRLSTNPCDYFDALSTGKQLKRIYLMLEDGTIFAHKTALGAVKGFECKISYRPLFPEKGSLQYQYAVDVNFTNASEFETGVLLENVSDNATLLSYMPAGYTTKVTTAYSAPTVSLKIYKRGDESTVATDTFTSEILDYFTIAQTPPVVNVGAPSSGISVVTVYSTGTTNLATGEWIKFRLVNKTGDVYDDITTTYIVRG